jgi:hypothetical protein
MKVALLLGILMADMFIGFYQLGGRQLGDGTGRAGLGGGVHAMDDVYPPPPPPPSFP